MKQQHLAKKCMCCHEQFTPDPRIGDKQKVCQKLTCKLYRKRIAQKKWCQKNPDYFKGRYQTLKDQIRSNRQNSQPKTPSDAQIIQDELTNCFNSLLRLIAIQDKLTYKITMTKDDLPKTIQDELTYLNSVYWRFKYTRRN